MKIGDLVWSTYSGIGQIVDIDWYTDIGTPFDYRVFYFNLDRFEGEDDHNLEVMCK
jgi:hypothetical protein